MARAKQLTHHLHAIEQEGVNDLKWLVVLEADLQRLFEADALAIDDVLLESFFDRQIAELRT